MQEQEKDVKGTSSTPDDQPKGTSNPDDGQPKDKDKNFAALRERAEKAEREKAEAEAKLEAVTSNAKPNLTADANLTDAQKAVFDRDLRMAIKGWRGKNSVTADEWSSIQKRVVFSGDELPDEIAEKIDAAHAQLPGVRERREKELVEKGRKSAMREFSDEDMDIGGGGDAGMTGGEPETRFTEKENRWLNTFGVKPDDRKNISKRSTEYQNWTILDPKRRNK